MGAVNNSNISTPTAMTMNLNHTLSLILDKVKKAMIEPATTNNSKSKMGVVGVLSKLQVVRIGLRRICGIMMLLFNKPHKTLRKGR
jgi:non-canonical (house-cleaning) NTP pyrophosphatase